MSVIVSLASFTGTNGQLLSAADAGWSLHPLYTGTAQIIDGAVRQTNTTNSLYLRTETPANADQTVRAFVRNKSNLTGQVINLVARCSDTLNTFFLAQYYYGAGGQIKLFKFENGTATQLGATTAVTEPAINAVKSLQLVVSGVSPSISLTVSWDGSPVISLTNQSATGLDGVGKVGLRFGTTTAAATDTTGSHIASFYAEDTAGAAVTLTGDGSTQSNTSSSGAINSTGTPTITLSALKNNTGTVLANQTGITAHVYEVATGNKVVTKTGLSADTSGIVTISDAALTAATTYRVVVVMSGGAEGMENKAAA